VNGRKVAQCNPDASCGEPTTRRAPTKKVHEEWRGIPPWCGGSPLPFGIEWIFENFFGFVMILFSSARVL